jgi:hypothetical protein
MHTSACLLFREKCGHELVDTLCHCEDHPRKWHWSWPPDIESGRMTRLGAWPLQCAFHVGARFSLHDWLGRSFNPTGIGWLDGHQASLIDQHCLQALSKIVWPIDSIGRYAFSTLSLRRHSHTLPSCIRGLIRPAAVSVCYHCEDHHRSFPQ